MCSRYSLTSPPEAVRRLFGYRNSANFPPRYNIAPSQPVAIVRESVGGPREGEGEKGADGERERGGHRVREGEREPASERELALVRWGLIPHWVKDPDNFTMLINARAETVREKPSFRAAMRYRRCLVPADGFYEWTGPKGDRQPYLIRPRAGGPMAFAGLWESWMGADGSEIDSMVIITVEANALVAPLHNRMPAILSPEQFDAWMDHRTTRPEEAQSLLGPAPDDLLEAIPVSQALNNPRNDSPEVQEPVGDRLL